MKWNPYYVAYAAAHGRSVVEMSAHDEEAWPGGRSTGFILWMSARWSQWAALRGYRRTASGHGDTYLGPDEHADFAGWLRGYAFTEAERARADTREEIPDPKIDRALSILG